MSLSQNPIRNNPKPTLKISSSRIDARLVPIVRGFYAAHPIPSRVPPELIVISGHLVALIAGLSLALSTRAWWWGVIGAVCVFLNQITDMLDGTHARATGQCRNSGDLLDHFLDPLSYAYWVIGIGVAADSIALVIPALLLLYSFITLTYILQRMTGELRIPRLGSTEYRFFIVLYGIISALICAILGESVAIRVAFYSLLAMMISYFLELVLQLRKSIKRVDTEFKLQDVDAWHAQGPHGRIF